MRFQRSTGLVSFLDGISSLCSHWSELKIDESAFYTRLTYYFHCTYKNKDLIVTEHETQNFKVVSLELRGKIICTLSL